MQSDLPAAGAVRDTASALIAPLFVLDIYDIQRAIC